MNCLIRHIKYILAPEIEKSIKRGLKESPCCNIVPPADDSLYALLPVPNFELNWCILLFIKNQSLLVVPNCDISTLIQYIWSWVWQAWFWTKYIRTSVEILLVLYVAALFKTMVNLYNKLCSNVCQPDELNENKHHVQIDPSKSARPNHNL